jgi:hypothetical protein
MAKISQKYVFHPCEAHILSRLDTLMLYINFRGFKKCCVLAQNPKWLAFDFTENINS